jgi:micrococcal nuclease
VTAARTLAYVASALLGLGPAQAACLFGPGESVSLRAVSARADPILADGRSILLPDLDIPTGRDGARLAAARNAIVDLASRGSVAADLVRPGLDRWGRTIARLLVHDGSPAPRWIEADLVARGLARAAPRWESAACDADLLRLEGEARAANRGLWGDPDESVVAATRSRELLRRAGAYVVVEGRIVGVGATSGPIFLNFGPDRWKDLSLVASKAAAEKFAAAGIPLAGAVGRTVRARGLLDVAASPRIELENLEQIEWLASGAQMSGR